MSGHKGHGVCHPRLSPASWPSLPQERGIGCGVRLGPLFVGYWLKPISRPSELPFDKRSDITCCRVWQPENRNISTHSRSLVTNTLPYTFA